LALSLVTQVLDNHPNVATSKDFSRLTCLIASGFPVKTKSVGKELRKRHQQSGHQEWRNAPLDRRV
jgi:hypothetical protein